MRRPPSWWLAWGLCALFVAIFRRHAVPNGVGLDYHDFVVVDPPLWM